MKIVAVVTWMWDKGRLPRPCYVYASSGSSIHPSSKIPKRTRARRSNDPEKIRFFEPFWISRVFHFSLRTFEQVEGLPEPLGTSDEIYTLSEIDISGSNETMQNALASIV